jgi:uncharacterized membrane protein
MGRPWWQAAGSPRLGFAMGGAYLVIGAGGLLLDVLGGTSDWWWWFVGSGWLVLGVIYLSSAVAMKRRAGVGR